MQRFALIGAGFIGSVHAANLAANPDVDFVFVYDVDTSRAGVPRGSRCPGSRPTSRRCSTRTPSMPCMSRRPPTPMPSTCGAPPMPAVAVLCEKPIDLDLDPCDRGGPDTRRQRLDQGHGQLQSALRS